MSVRRVRHTTKAGEPRERWMIDVFYIHASGERERIRRVSPVQTRRGAEQYERQAVAELLRGGPPKQREAARKEGEGRPKVPTLASFAKEFIEIHARANNKPSEVCAKELLFKNHLLPAFGRMQLDQIGPRDLEHYKALKVEKGYHPKSINNQLSSLSSLLTVALDWGLIDHKPRFKWMKVPEQPFDFLDFDEAERLIAGAEEAWRPMVLLALRTGLRIGELRALQWDNVDLVAGRLAVRCSAWKRSVGSPKNRRNRVIPLSPATVDVLRRHRHLRGDFVFCNDDGSILTDDEVKHPLRRACARAGLRKIGWHALRHSFASHLVMKGVPLKVVQELMGHSTMTMTLRYAHLTPELHQGAIRLLDVQRDGRMMAECAEPTASRRLTARTK